MDFVSASLIAFLLSLILLWVRKRKEHFSVFKRNGIPGPKPSFWTGNYDEFARLREDLITECVKKYGNVAGFFLGAKPYVIVTDQELMRTIQVKEFAKFADRDVIFSDLGISQPELGLSVFALHGEEWRKTRSLITPSFSTSKLRKVMPTLNEAGDIFMEKVQKSCNNEYINIVGIVKNLTLDIVTKVALGIDTAVQHSTDSKLVSSAKLCLSADSTDILLATSLCFPELEPLLTKLRNIFDNARYLFGLPSVKMITEEIRKITNYRRKSSQKREDLLQNLIDEKADLGSLLSKKAEDLAISSENKEDKKIEHNTQGSKLGEHFSLSDDAIVGNAVAMVLAGFGTTSLTLCYLAYHLSKHQDVQDRLREEINNQVGERKVITYDDLSKCTYMEQVISETLRLHPTNFVATNRVVLESLQYKDMTIPKGVTVIIPPSYLQKNPENWLDPETFDPERFSPENKPFVNPSIYQPFGFGPRNCLGMRFAQIVIKLMLARLIKSYRLKSDADKEAKVDDALFFPEPMEILLKMEPL